ncbi:hypothetical protein U9M48_044676 [Paspalum notatum var. saurae]|uniref:Uncharacterized protein n=1 Tax=Paspalum notatum var. saurae TaxID=547442 RepID=A0AAQ3XIH8_PASNO
MEELDECEVLWPETWDRDTHEPPPSPVRVHPSEARSRPVDVPCPKAAAARSCRANGPTRDGDHGGGGGGSSNAIVPPHLLLSGRRRSEAETAWTLRATGPPCQRARDLRHLRDAVLRMTGFIEG